MDPSKSGLGLLCRLSHQNLIFQKSFVPVFGAHASDVESAGGVVVADDIKEVHVVVRWKPGSGKDTSPSTWYRNIISWKRLCLKAGLMEVSRKVLIRRASALILTL